jgi:glycosyltransferase involved in cell wall biosynthesis
MRRWGIPEEKAVVIPNGVQLIEPVSEAQRLKIRAEVGAPEGCVLMGMVGNFREGKGHEDLIRALAPVSRKEHPEWHLVLVGDGPKSSPMRKLAIELGLGEKIHFTGRRDDVLSILPALDLFIYPSHSEGMPNALLEAMAAGVPCIASDIPVHRDLLDGGAAGRLVPPGNPEELSRALVELLNGDDVERLGRLGRERIRESFSEQVMVQNYIELYGRLLGEA